MNRTLIFAALVAVGLPLGGASCYHAIVGTDAQAAKTVTVHAVESACKGYLLALRDATAATLSDAAVATVNSVRAQLNPICPGKGGGGQWVAGPTDAIVTVNEGTARIIGVLPDGGS